jgi:signal transduction histidine kinase
MASSLFDFLSFLRPDDAALSDRETWLVQVYRLLSVVGGALIPVFGALYQTLPTAYVDPWWLRFVMTGLLGVVFVLSYVSAWVRRQYTILMWGCLYVVMAWIGTLAALNQVSGDYAVAFLFVFCVVGVCIGIGLQRMGPLVWFLGYALLLVGSIYLVVTAPETSSVALVGCTATLSIVLYVVFQARLSMQRQLKAAREEAKTASRLKSALLANMSHEVRTPLTSILGFAELIADADPDNPEALAHSIRRSGRRLLDTLDSVLQVSRLESGAVDLEPEP